jgi:hypothetical protein
MSLSYGWEKLFAAIHGAVSSEQSLRERLESAYDNHLIGLEEDHVPPDVWADLKGLEKAVEGSAAASGSAMSDEEAAQWLQTIVSMFSKVAQAHGGENYRRETKM